MTPKVAICRCNSYKPEEVSQAVSRALDGLGGLSAFVKPGWTVLLKPNLLAAKLPDAAVTTHPTVVEAVAREVINVGATPVIGDSPPYQGRSSGSYGRLCRETGMSEIADRLKIEIVSLDHPWREVKSAGKLFQRLPAASTFLDADAVINLPKLKTHGLTGFTGAVKNMFGCVPGLKKSQLHLQAREDRETFAQMLVDVFATCKPTLNLIDAVVAMEGRGPSNGRPREVGAILASADAVALDAVICEIVGLAPSTISTTRLAAEQGLGEMRLEFIELIGQKITELQIRDFQPSPTGGSGLSRIPEPFHKLLKDQLTPMPRIDTAKCRGCGDCAKVCAAEAMTIAPNAGETAKQIAQVDLAKCIACYCCDEACAYGAIEVKKGWLGELMSRLSTGNQTVR